ncbi:hypothetical protein Trydic_g16823 [Trypoxylus dichotomus]
MSSSVNERLKVRQKHPVNRTANIFENTESSRSFGKKHTHDSFESSQSACQNDRYDRSKLSSTIPSSRFSVNDRLKKYRQNLYNRKNEIVKVHQVLNKPKATERARSNSHPNSSERTASLLGKHNRSKEEKYTEGETDYEVGGKRRKIVEYSQNIAIKKDRDPHLKQDTICNNNTVVQEVCNRNDNDMDWSPIDQNEVVNNIQKFREDYKESSDKVLNLSQVSTNSFTTTNMESQMLYIVVDTNIFISHLNVIRNVLSEMYAAYNHVVHIPWIVVQELDYFKDGRLGSPVMLIAAKKAIKFINDNLIQKHPRLKGQTVAEELYQKGSSSNPDDSILFYCLQLAQTSKNVILLSNDVNLRNKALINNVSSCGPKQILTHIKNMHINNKNKEKICEMNSTLSQLCTGIILTEMEEAYGSVLNQLIREPPWDLKQCLIYLKRFWNPVFSLIITQKQCLKVIEDLLTKIQSSNDLSAEKDMEEFIKLCLSLCTCTVYDLTL